MNETSPAAAGSDLATRFAAGVVMIAIAGVAIWTGGWLFRVLLLAAAAAMMVEWGDMHRSPRLWGWLGAALMLLPAIVIPELLYKVVDDNPQEITAVLFDKAWV